MRVLLLSEGDAESWDSWSGISKSLVDQLRAEGHQVDVGDVDLYGASRVAAAASTFALNQRHWTARFHLGEAPFKLRSRAARQILERSPRPDVILQVGATFQLPTSIGIPYCLCCDSNIRVAEDGLQSGHSDATNLRTDELKGIADREFAVYRSAAAIFTLSDRLRRSFLKDFGMSPATVRAIYAGPNLDLAHVPASRPPRPNDRPPTVLFVGRQFHRKGGDTLVEALQRIRTLLPTARLVVVGPPARSIEAPGVICLGELDKNQPEGWQALREAYTTADVFALPTRFEPFGVAFVEAMHFGLPCVGPDAWAVPEIIAEGRTGFTVPVDDVDALAQRLFQLLSDPAGARAMGDVGRQRAQELFTWPRVVARMTDVIRTIVPRDGDRRPVAC